MNESSPGDVLSTLKVLLSDYVGWRTLPSGAKVPAIAALMPSERIEGTVAGLEVVVVQQLLRDTVHLLDSSYMEQHRCRVFLKQYRLPSRSNASEINAIFNASDVIEGHWGALATLRPVGLDERSGTLAVYSCEIEMVPQARRTTP